MDKRLVVLLAAALLAMATAGCAVTVEWGVRVPASGEEEGKPVRYKAGPAITIGDGSGVNSRVPTGTWMGIGTQPEKVGPQRRR